ncbi:hypothetical protein ACWD04_10560 [Streptomyces sp. NPDC002911]
MRSSRDGRRRGRPVLRRREAPAVAAHRPGPLRRPAIDLGSSGARAWAPEQGLVAGGPSGREDGVGRPVRRGRIVDPESGAGLPARIAGCQGVPVRVGPDPSTAVGRGVALIPGSVLGSAGAGALSVRPVRLR